MASGRRFASSPVPGPAPRLLSRRTRTGFCAPLRGHGAGYRAGRGRCEGRPAAVPTLERARTAEAAPGRRSRRAPATSAPTASSASRTPSRRLGFLKAAFSFAPATMLRPAGRDDQLRERSTNRRTLCGHGGFMKAIRVDRFGGPEVLRPVEISDPQPGPGQLLVRVEAAGVNYIDVYQRTGLYPNPLPYTPGLEGAGVVEGVGSGRRGLSRRRARHLGQRARGVRRARARARRERRGDPGRPGRAGGSGAHAPGHDGSVPLHQHVPVARGRDLPRSRGRGRRRAPARADGQEAWRACDRHRLDRGESAPRARSGRGRRRPVHAGGLPGGRAAADARTRRPGRLRLGGQDDRPRRASTAWRRAA